MAVDMDQNPNNRCPLTPEQLPIRIYLGGSFDPVHNSHLTMLQHVAQCMSSAALTGQQPIEAFLMPTSRSPLKQNSSSPQHRLQMLSLAINDFYYKNKTQCQPKQHSAPSHSNSPKPHPSQPHKITEKSAQTLLENSVEQNNGVLNIGISEAEIWQTPPTYTIETLRTLRAENPAASLVFVVGADNIANLSKWREGDKLTQFAHLWIMPRDRLQNKQQIADLLPETLKPQLTEDVKDLKTSRKGHIYIDSVSVAPISSTSIRKNIYNGAHLVAKTALPDPVYSYIMKNNLYAHHDSDNDHPLINQT